MRRRQPVPSELLINPLEEHVDSRFTMRQTMVLLVSDEVRADDYAPCSLTCRVPMLSHGNYHLSESSAIAEYLDELLPPPGYRALYPSSICERARARLCGVAEQLLTGSMGTLFDEWSIADTDLALMLQRLLNNGHVMPERLASYARGQWQRPAVQAWLALPRSD